MFITWIARNNFDHDKAVKKAALQAESLIISFQITWVGGGGGVVIENLQ